MAGARAVLEYHQRTKLHPEATPARRVDAALIPRQYKRYTGVPLVPLPQPLRPDASLFEVHAAARAAPHGLTPATLASVLHYSAGIVRRRRLDGRELEFRAASCTGAAYHVELYVVCAGLPDLPAGVYHYDVPSGSLRPMRAGDYRRALAAACCDEAIAGCGASIVLTSTFWRNAWRYEERAYRHVFWDSGTILANLLAVSEAHGLMPHLHTAFVDDDVNALLGLDARREAAVAVVSLGDGTAAGAAPSQEALNLTEEPLSRAEIEHPLIWQTHADSGLAGCDAVGAWRQALRSLPASAPARAVSHRDRPVLSLAESIERRGSARRFSPDPLATADLREVLHAARGGARADQASAASLCRAAMVVNRVEGLASGAYAVGPGGELELLRGGDYAVQAQHLALDQPAAARAAANLYFLADAGAVADILGERGYRALQLEAGIRTGQVYLAATALGLKATGLTFYDDEVARFFGFGPEETLVLMLVAFGA